MRSAARSRAVHAGCWTCAPGGRVGMPGHGCPAVDEQRERCPALRPLPAERRARRFRASAPPVELVALVGRAVDGGGHGPREVPQSRDSGGGDPLEPRLGDGLPEPGGGLVARREHRLGQRHDGHARRDHRGLDGEPGAQGERPRSQLPRRGHRLHDRQPAVDRKRSRVRRGLRPRDACAAATPAARLRSGQASCGTMHPCRLPSIRM